MTLDFPGADKLVASLDAAVALGDDRAVTDALRKSLCELICDEEVSLPACVLEPISDHYARRELYRVLTESGAGLAPPASMTAADDGELVEETT